jgi:hypothetical protein
MSETVLSFAQAASACPAVGGAKPSVKTIYFWCDTGIKVGGGRVKLECARRGGIRVTSAEAIERFFAAVSGGPERPEVETPAQRKRAANKDIEFLRKAFAKV